MPLSIFQPSQIFVCRIEQNESFEDVKKVSEVCSVVMNLLQGQVPSRVIGLIKQLLLSQKTYKTVNCFTKVRHFVEE